MWLSFEVACQKIRLKIIKMNFILFFKQKSGKAISLSYWNEGIWGRQGRFLALTFQVAVFRCACDDHSLTYLCRCVSKWWLKWERSSDSLLVGSSFSFYPPGFSGWGPANRTDKRQMNERTVYRFMEVLHTRRALIRKWRPKETVQFVGGNI